LSNKKNKNNTGIKLKYKVIYLLTFLSLISYNIAHAYFLIDNHSNALRIDPDSNHHTSLNDNAFYLYDNYFYNHKNSFLTKKNNGFVYVDQIKINISLKILARISIYPEASIDRLLLANLRIKDLVSEYLDLQKKSQLIFNDNYVAETREIQGINHSDKVKDRLESIEDEKKKINEKILNINRLGSMPQEDILSKETLSVVLDADKRNKQILSLNMAADVKDSSKVVKSIVDFKKIDGDMGRQIIDRKENSELPWVFRFFLKILNYMLMNRIEVILYMIFIAVVGYFIVMLIRR